MPAKTNVYISVHDTFSNSNIFALSRIKKDRGKDRGREKELLRWRCQNLICKHQNNTIIVQCWRSTNRIKTSCFSCRFRRGFSMICTITLFWLFFFAYSSSQLFWVHFWSFSLSQWFPLSLSIAINYCNLFSFLEHTTKKIFA